MMTFIRSIGLASRDTFLVQSFLNEDFWNGDSHPSVARMPFQPCSSLGQNEHNDKVFIPLSEWSILILFFYIPVIIIIHISVPVSPQASRVWAWWQSVTAICQASGSFTSPPFFKIIDEIFLRPCYTRFFLHYGSRQEGARTKNQLCWNQTSEFCQILGWNGFVGVLLL